MNIVDKVAEAIAEIPGKPSSREIARIAIEAYQTELWTPAFGHSSHFFPEMRRHRTNALVAQILKIVGKYLCEHGGARGHRDAGRELTEALFEAGAEVITDSDRALAGLLPRGPHGLTIEELQIIECRRIEAMLKPTPPFLVTETVLKSHE